jgi:alpha-tubulin suppressor-like RCC1 family protein
MDQDEHVPRPVEALKGIAIKSLACGDSHVLAMSDVGRVYSWGIGYYGTLGHGDETTLTTPKLIEALVDEVIVAGSGGANHSIVVSEDGRGYVWGRDQCGQLGLPPVVTGGGKVVRLNQKIPILKEFPEKVKLVAACCNHTLVLLTSGRVLSYGFNEHGELGRIKNEDNDDPCIDPNHFDGAVAHIAAGWTHCAAITESGALYTWGHGELGRLGHPHEMNEKFPKMVVTDPAVKFQDVSCGQSHSLGLDRGGRMWAWGSADYGKLGVPIDGGSFISPPQLLEFKLDGLAGVWCGTNHSMTFKP